MECHQLQKMLDRGTGPLSDEAREHLASCEPCRELAESAKLTAALRGAREAESEPSEPDFDAMWSDLSEEVDQPAPWRELSTPFRRALASAVMLAVAGLVVWWMPREDLGVYPSTRMAAVVSAFAAFGFACIAAALRPLYRPAPSALSRGLLVGAGLVVPLVAALLPVAHTSMAISLQGLGAELLPEAARCFAFGILTAAPVVAGWLLFRRTTRSLVWPALLIGAAAGLAANLVLQLHCPIVHPEHLLLGHVTVPLVLLLGALIVALRPEIGAATDAP